MSRFMDTPMRIDYPSEARAAAVEYWRAVRAGLVHAEPHDFSPSVQDRIEAHCFNARKHIEAAAREMRAAKALAGEVV